jgi:hypothetical protein
MGLAYKIINTERKELDRVTCDKCRNEIEKVSDGGWNPFGEPFSMYHEPVFKDYFLLDKSWGYFSGKDTETHRAVLCEGCYDEIFKGVNIDTSNYM